MKKVTEKFLDSLLELSNRDCFGEDEFTKGRLCEYFGNDMEAAYIAGWTDGKICSAREILRGGKTINRSNRKE